MRAIKYLLENVSFSKRILSPKRKIIKFVKDKKETVDSICFIFCSDKYLQKLNKQFLKHDELTDVITFDYSTKTGISGDVFISIERVKENSSTYNVRLQEELARVMIHGVLHLMGYNDKTEKEKKIIRKLENEYLKSIK